MTEIQQPGAPSVIRIKRKADDAPLDTVHLQGSKRRATGHTYIFKRLDQERIPSTPAVKQEYDDDGIPRIRTTPKGEEKRDPYATGRSREQSPVQTRQYTPVQSPSEPRRFHLSSLLSTGSAAKGKKNDVATFVERRIRALNGIASTAAGLDSQRDSASQQEQRVFKRPTGRARTHQSAAQATPALPAPVDPSMAQRMDLWSQETSQEEKQKTSQVTADTTTPDADAMDIDNEVDYVYDTYYRHMVAEGDMPDKGISFGQLVIDEDQEDLWETYLDGNESDDKEFETDDEDSNGAYIPLAQCFISGLLTFS
jgi:hypothetical protein